MEKGFLVRAVERSKMLTVGRTRTHAVMCGADLGSEASPWGS